jgi:hypothetical protein
MHLQRIMLALSLTLTVACGPNYKTVEVAETDRPPSQNAPDAIPNASAPFEPPPGSTSAPSIPLDGYKRIEWKLLRGLEVKTGKTTPDLAGFVGANVRINGFMVPFDDDIEEVTEFLLVPEAGMCIHTPPPPPNQIILVEVASGGANRVEWDKEVSVYGQFQIADGNSPYGKTGFKISAVRARAD